MCRERQEALRRHGQTRFSFQAKEEKTAMPPPAEEDDALGLGFLFGNVGQDGEGDGMEEEVLDKVRFSRVQIGP